VLFRSELSRIGVESGIPVSYGVITCNTFEQAQARSGSGGGNKGWEAALAAIEMANLLRKMRDDS
jgi:6,7-dimethyl-8-ribityllumazine synthase